MQFHNDPTVAAAEQEGCAVAHDVRAVVFPCERLIQRGQLVLQHAEYLHAELLRRAFRELDIREHEVIRHGWKEHVAELAAECEADRDSEHADEHGQGRPAVRDAGLEKWPVVGVHEARQAIGAGILNAREPARTALACANMREVRRQDELGFHQ